jgi:hypothetical protein
MQECQARAPLATFDELKSFDPELISIVSTYDPRNIPQYLLWSFAKNGWSPLF